MNEIKIYKQAIGTYGEDAQMKMCIEEMAELTQAICKSFRGKEDLENIAEEIADVEIMLAQAKLIFKIDDNEIYQKKEEKIRRLEERLNNVNA